MLVIDASVALAASAADRFDRFSAERLVAPSLMWSEARSGLHELLWRREIEADDANGARGRLERCPVEMRDPLELGPEAWRVAEELGWAKTYDAEYVALACHLDAPLLTLDARLRSSAGGLVRIVGPTEI